MTESISNNSPRDFRQEVTDNIVRLLEEGTAPWQKPWQASAETGMPQNPTTGKIYRGGNAIHLLVVGMMRGHSDARWMTYKQASEEKWQVRKGEKGTQIEFWDVRKAEEPSPGETDDKRKSRLIYRIFTVFNATQIDGVPPIEPKIHTEFESIEIGERILRGSGANIFHDQPNRAFYRKTTDTIHLPPRHAFENAGAYYGTSLHELAHWTGHQSRLNRATLGESYRFGDINYAKEELRAELASVFLAAEHGIPHDPSVHAAYVGSWIKALKDDKNEIFRAAHDAAAAADFINALGQTIGTEKIEQSSDEREGAFVQRIESERRGISQEVEREM